MDEAEDEGIDWRKIKKGLIPWSGDEYMEVLSFREKLEETPKDDWDLSPRRIAIEAEDGLSVYQLNGLMHENQIGFFINERYADKDRTTRAAHMMRYFEMNWFLGRHKARFIKEGFIRTCEEPGRLEVNTNLFQALAEAPYTRTHGRGRMRKPTFDLATIIARTKELIREEEEKEPGEQNPGKEP